MPEIIVRITQFIVSLPFRLALAIFINLKIEGLDNVSRLDESKGIILASNHHSQIDSIAIACSLPLFSKHLPIYFVSLDQKEYVRFPIGKYFYGGPLFSLLGAYSIKYGLRDYSVTLSKHIELVKQGKTVMIYPEGGIVLGHELGEARGGVAYLAKETSAPIIPIAIMGEENMRWWQFLTFQRRVTISFGKPLYFNDIDVKNVPEEKRYRLAAQNIMQEIKHLIDKQHQKEHVPHPIRIKPRSIKQPA
ncbi:MAG: lysophospholipid acyltransferase family protein [Patescibacteria group bacterium]